MKQKLDHRLYLVILACTAVILGLVPLHALLTVWAASLVGHYTALRLWEEVLLIPAVLATAWLLARDHRLRKIFVSSLLVRLIFVYAAIVIVWGVVSYLRGAVSLKALGYGVIIDLRFLIFFLVVWVTAMSGRWLNRFWQKLVLIPAAVVVTFGLLQRFILPHDFLKHFGYNDSTISPFETIDHKVQYLRIQSTLRGANLLGAYLIIVLSIALAGLRRYALWAMLVVGLAVLILSGSRAAWIGTFVALLTLLFLRLPTRRGKLFLLSGLAVFGLAGATTVYALRDNDFVQNTVFHTDERSTSSESSNAAHLRTSRFALEQVAREPLGRGPGTAGPASVYNAESPARIAENYFLQIAQETGWLGLIVFTGVYVLTGRELWLRRKEQLSRALFAALLGLTCVALLMHLWTDETVAFLFWGLAGIALATPINRSVLLTREKS